MVGLLDKTKTYIMLLLHVTDFVNFGIDVLEISTTLNISAKMKYA